MSCIHLIILQKYSCTLGILSALLVWCRKFYIPGGGYNGVAWDLRTKTMKLPVLHCVIICIVCVTVSVQVLKLHTCLAPYKVAVLPTQEGNQKLCMVSISCVLGHQYFSVHLKHQTLSQHSELCHLTYQDLWSPVLHTESQCDLSLVL